MKQPDLRADSDERTRPGFQYSSCRLASRFHRAHKTSAARLHLSSLTDADLSLTVAEARSVRGARAGPGGVAAGRQGRRRLN